MDILAGAILAFVLFSPITINLTEDRDAGNAVNAFERLTKHPDEVHILFEVYQRGSDEKAVRERLDALALFLKDNPSFGAHIVSYAGRRSCRGKALRRAKIARDYLIRKRKIERDRITLIDGGYRQEWAVQLWYAPANAKDPVPITETIDKDRVQTTKNCDP